MRNQIGCRGSVSSLTPCVPAIANPLRHDSLFRRHLSNIALVDQRVCAVTPDIDLGLNWRTASTEFLENITAICLPKVFGFAGSKWCELSFHRGGWVNTAGHFSGDWQATGLHPIGLLAIGLESPLKLPQPTAKSRTVIRETCRRCSKQRGCGGGDCQRTELSSPSLQSVFQGEEE
jgi:hypothetical protein